MINGVLVGRTVKDILPALKTNSDGLKQVLDELMRQYKTKQDEMDSWKVGSIPLAGPSPPKQLLLAG
jgi:prefoldin subunit 2